MFCVSYLRRQLHLQVLHTVDKNVDFKDVESRTATKRWAGGGGWGDAGHRP